MARTPSAIGRRRRGERMAALVIAANRRAFGPNPRPPDASRTRQHPSRAQPDQPLRHSPLAAVQDADDDFLADVAPLGQADGAILDARFERNRRRVHVAAEGRTSGFDPSDVRRRAIDALRSGLDERLRQQAASRMHRPGLEAADAEVVAPDQNRRPIAKRAFDVPIHRQRRAAHRRIPAPHRGPTRPLAPRRVRTGPSGRRRADVLNLDVLAEDEVRQALADASLADAGRSTTSRSRSSDTRMSLIIRPCGVSSAA